MIRVRVDTEQIELRFLRAVWDSPFVRSQIEATARTTAGIFKINQNDLLRLRFPRPPIDHQHQIVEVLERDLTIVDALERQIESAKSGAGALRRAMLSAAFAGKLVPQDPTDEPMPVPLKTRSDTWAPV